MGEGWDEHGNDFSKAANDVRLFSFFYFFIFRDKGARRWGQAERVFLRSAVQSKGTRYIDSGKKLA